MLMANGVRKTEDLWAMRRNKGLAVSEDAVICGKQLCVKMINAIGSKSDRMAIEVAAQALKLPHRYCPESFTNLPTSSILGFVKDSEQAAVVRFAKAASKSAAAAQPTPKSAAPQSSELLKLAGIDLASLPADGDSQVQPMEDNELPCLYDLQADKADDVEMKDADESKDAPARSTFSLVEQADAEKSADAAENDALIDADSDMDSIAEDADELEIEELEEGYLDADLEDGAHARDEADLALEEAEQGWDLGPEEAELAAAEQAESDAEIARAEMLDDDDEDGEDSDVESADGKQKAKQKQGEEWLLKTSKDDVDARCDRIEYFFRPRKLELVSLYQFKSEWDVERLKANKPLNENLSEAQRAAVEARRREHYPYSSEFLKDKEVVRRTKAVIPVLIGRKIPNPVRDFEGYAMQMMALLKPWRIPFAHEKDPGPQLKQPEQTWTEAFKEWRADIDRQDVDADDADHKDEILLMRKQARDFIKHWGSFFEGAELAKAETAARKAAGKDTGSARRRGCPVPGFEMDGYDSDSGMFDPDDEAGLPITSLATDC